MTIAALLLAGSLSLLSAPRVAAPTAQESEQYALFVDSAADLDTAEQIAMWEAFLLKYPRSPYLANARTKIAELKGERPAPAPAPAPALPPPARKPAPARVASAKPAAAPADYDPDLAFLYEDGPAAAATPAPAPAPAVETPAPAPPAPAAQRRPATPEAQFFATPEPPPAPRRAKPSAHSVWDAPPSETASASMWDEPAPAPRKKKKKESRELAMSGAGSRAPSVQPRRQPRAAAQREWLDTEVAAFHSLSLVEDPYVHNSLTGVEVSRRFGRRLALEVEAAAAQSEETPALRSLRAEGRQPRVITKSNYAAGAGVQLGILAPGGRNDLFVLGGGGIVNSDVEACKKGDAACETSLRFKGVNFSYATAGAGHRFYVTSRIALHTEVRSRFVFELVDGVTTPRSTYQVNVGPSFSF